MEFYIFAVFFLVAPLVVLGNIIPLIKEHNKATNGITNYDPFMRKFVYKVNLTGEEIINLLNTHNDADVLSCEFDFERAVIEFAEYVFYRKYGSRGRYGSYRKYYYRIQEYEGYSVLTLEQVSLIGSRSNIMYKLNPFMVSKLNAEIIPYSESYF